MEYNLKDITNLQKIAGDTGKSYVGYLNKQKVFVKQNSTPFFVAVANEKLTPKMLWSKTIDNYFWIAQEWITGRTLKSYEISKFKKQTMQILKKLHHSDYLALMLYRLEGQDLEPIDFLQEYYWQLPKELEQEAILKDVYTCLEDAQPVFNHFNICACHGDINHKNFLFKNEEEKDIYLIDWDSAILSDCFSDLGYLLYRYVDSSKWDEWLQEYGETNSKENIHKIWWYGQMQHLLQIKHQYQKGRFKLVKEELNYLKQLNKRKEQYYARSK